MRRALLAAGLLGVALVPSIALVAFRDEGGTSVAAEGPRPGRYTGSEPPGVNTLPQFRLPTFDGKLVDSKNLRGKVVVATFVDSACRESCPIIVGELGRALPQLAADERRQVAALAISVQPAVDTRAHVQRFLRERRALGQLAYLVGSERALRPVWKAFHVLSAADTGDADVHSADVRIFDRNGLWVSTLHVGVDLSPANLLHDIREALRQPLTSS
jgi:cytochrome oxidase Cu insertion factor (SCO1/SenC/PrrC family)